MGFMTTNHDEAGGDFQPIEPGEYEVTVSNVKIETSSKGNPMLTVEMTVRQDVNQEHKNQKVWDRLVETEKAMFKFQQYAKAAGFPDGKDFDTMADFAKELMGSCVKIRTDLEEYQDKEYVRVKFASESEYPRQRSGNPFNVPGGNDGPPVDISDDDLPF